MCIKSWSLMISWYDKRHSDHSPYQLSPTSRHDTATKKFLQIWQLRLSVGPYKVVRKFTLGRGSPRPGHRRDGPVNHIGKAHDFHAYAAMDSFLLSIFLSFSLFLYLVFLLCQNFRENIIRPILGGHNHFDARAPTFQYNIFDAPYTNVSVFQNPSPLQSHST